MLSSIHPLGERGRRNTWAVTAVAFTAAVIVSGAIVGAALGLAGSLVFDETGSTTRLIIVGLAATAAGLLDLAGFSPPGPSRQVNEHWIGHYRGWVYGAAFGSQLGLGYATYVVTWMVPATLLSQTVTGSWEAGALVGAIFGFGRSISVLTAGWIRRPSDLGRFHRLMARLGPPVRRVGAYTISVAGVIGIAGALL